MATPYNSTDAQNSAAPNEQAAVQPDQQSQATSSQHATGLDVIRGSFSTAFDQIVKEIEPQINEFASNFARHAIDRGGNVGKLAVERVKTQSWGRIGLAAALFVGAVAVLGYQAAEASAEQDSLH